MKLCAVKWCACLATDNSEYCTVHQQHTDSHPKLRVKRTALAQRAVMSTTRIVNSVTGLAGLSASSAITDRQTSRELNPMLPNACPKVKPGGLTRTERKIQKKRDQEKERAECYRKVDARDQMRCRVSGVRVNPYAIDPRVRGEHHHLLYRSRGGAHQTQNVCLVSKAVHEQIHAGLLRVTGDADARDHTGKLCGLVVERPTPEGWEVVKCC